MIIPITPIAAASIKLLEPVIKPIPNKKTANIITPKRLEFSFSINMTNKFIRTFNRVNYHLNNLNILAFPGEIDNSMHIKINDNRIENHHLINTVYNEIAFTEEKRKK